MPSGIIPSAKEQHLDAAMQFLQAAGRLQQTKINSSKWQVSLSDGILNGTPLVYDQLSMGNAYAWWLSRDTTRAGVVERAAGKNRLVQINDDEQRLAIKKAIAIAHGDQAPTLVMLPIKKKATE